MTTRKPGSTEDWTHLGKLDTSRVLVRAEGAIWNGLAALGVPAGITKVLKWSVRGAVLAAVAVYSIYLLIPVVLVCAVLWAMAQPSRGSVASESRASSEILEFRDGHSGYGCYNDSNLKVHD